MAPAPIRIDLSMMLRVLLFGPEAAAMARSSVEIDVPECATCATVRERLGADFPALRPHLPSGRIAVNSEFAAPDRRVAATDEIALIGLVSGG